jgi:hypothetical protein
MNLPDPSERRHYDVANNYLLPLQERSLRNSAILKLWFSYADRVVLEEVVDDDLSDSVILESGFCNWLLKETVKSIFGPSGCIPQDMSVHLDPGWLVEFFRITSCVLRHVGAVRCAHIVGVKHAVLWGNRRRLSARNRVHLGRQLFLVGCWDELTTSRLFSCLAALTLRKWFF